MTLESIPFSGLRASLIPLDACLGVGGAPQSATGQATLLTGQNVPATIGYHYGPKPDSAVADLLQNGNIFSVLRKHGKQAKFINAYPPRYFSAIQSGKRLYSAIPLAAVSAGLPLLTQHDLITGKALSADFTAQGWREVLNLPDTPVLSYQQAGERLASLSMQNDLTFFEYWLSDYAGHRQDMAQAVTLLESFDQILGGLFNAWNDEQGLVLITSDHGNLEDLTTRRHTFNPVPAILVGSETLRRDFLKGMTSLSDVAPAILKLLI